MATFTLRPPAPFRLDLTAWVLRRMPVNQMDRWENGTYSRALIIHDEAREVSVTQTGPPEAPELTVTTDASETDASPLLTNLLGLDVDLTDFQRMARSDEHLSELAGRFLGFRPPRFTSVFEALVNGVSCQQISLTVGITLLNRLCTACGLAAGGHHAFARPEDMAEASVDDLKRLGYSGRKAEYILTIARTASAGELDRERLQNLDDASLATTLCQIHGVGRWTAQYVALRGMGRLDVIPADDVGAQAKLRRWLNLTEVPDYEGVHRLVDRWSPYRGLIYFLLLLNTLANEGLVDA